MATTSYAIALGSNRRHGRHGAPADVVRAGLEALAGLGKIEAASAIRATPALGPAGRGFANAAALLATDLAPDDLLDALKAIERRFGRRGGRRWGPRVLDLDILLWSEGPWGGPGPIIPHPAFRTRAFVLDPLAEIAPGWRDPIGGLSVRQLHARLTAPRPAHAPDRSRP
ncbi:2-amino-4-hydroxy-6-hydroxymethyldihydropteridine diphosphokinase [Sphingosinicella sp. LHD-64]|uniref:2-amino-4-hydroxy-6- hydroxymethyldihydropteridine diphosphokinase n=1 Tax=Sphingosinicella sp. LHD-64 TaxID=3072139 RepID=UPI0028109ACB|nr:2-amino-4-hydroxy-6-hydroxymethyldihydropteridine diphosphokinase [Sphingosinicella sp. LHD-64]MDQ8754896.1 2-amino-4-hydroxy-6-hydroxymethyldihydropteridine diphosphokinase [Sphingosinicella sp. LHD-64]